MIDLYNVKNLDNYYEKLNIGIGMSRMWNTLQTKSEYGSDRSERGYQLVAKSMAGSIARKLELNANIAEILTMCRGSFFPAKGQAGKKVVMQYLEDRNMNMSEFDLAREFVEYDLYESGNVITPEFDNLLKELFDTSLEAKTPEVQIARICGESIEGIKRIERNSTLNSVDLLYRFSKDIEDECVQSRRPTHSKKLQEMLEKLPPEEERQLTEDEKRKVYSKLDKFVKLSLGEPIEGVYKYIGTDDIDR